MVSYDPASNNFNDHMTMEDSRRMNLLAPG